MTLTELTIFASTELCGLFPAKQKPLVLFILSELIGILNLMMKLQNEVAKSIRLILVSFFHVKKFFFSYLIAK